MFVSSSVVICLSRKYKEAPPCTLISLFQEQWILMLLVTVKQTYAKVHQTTTHKLWPTQSEQPVFVSQHRNIFELPVKLQIAISWHHTFQQEFHMLLAGKNPYTRVVPVNRGHLL